MLRSKMVINSVDQNYLYDTFIFHIRVIKHIRWENYDKF